MASFWLQMIYNEQIIVKENKYKCKTNKYFYVETLYVGEGENHRLKPVEYSTMLENNYKSTRVYKR